MVAFKFDQILVTSVSLMQGDRMVRLDEVILLTRAKEGRYETLLHMRNGCQLLDVKSSFLFDRFLDKGHSCTDQKLRYFRVSRRQLITECPQV